ncbi:hypothetical protein JCM3770_005350 [Rhodotorula araucariae]
MFSSLWTACTTLLAPPGPAPSRAAPAPLSDSNSEDPRWQARSPSARPSASASATRASCIFCDVTAASPGFAVVHEDAEFVVFWDRAPAARVHLLAVPKTHVDSVKTLRGEDVGMLERMKGVGRRVLVEQGVPEGEQRLGFHIPPFFSVNHLHLHLLSLPLPFPGSIKYRPSIPSAPRSARIKGFSWFVEVDQVIAILQAGQRVKVGSVKESARPAR